MSAPVYLSLCPCGTEARSPTAAPPPGWRLINPATRAVRCPDCARGADPLPDQLAALDAATLDACLAALHRRDDALRAEQLRLEGELARYQREWLRRAGYLTRVSIAKARMLIEGRRVDGPGAPPRLPAATPATARSAARP